MLQHEQVSIQPDPYQPYAISQAIRTGDLLFVSGQTAVNDQGEIVGLNDFDLQAEQVFQNLKQVLEAGQSNLASVVKVTIYLTDMQHFEKVVALRRQWFTAPFPADTIVQVQSLFSPEVLLEIDAIAVAHQESK